MQRKWGIFRSRATDGTLLSSWYVEYPHGTAASFSTWKDAEKWAIKWYIDVYQQPEEDN